ncbi:APC family permease [Aeromicrobium sp. Leaf350]|uniref:APC family permease n=1 Tax=Aeromicrobium sp. Leaf350 TaxID=2876565 RepID=UPI001E45B5E3|nr:APC family permease [Aeromicrobium sp. Leaf350]
MTAPAPLARRLGLGDAIAIGVGSMMGAGVFSVFAPAATAAGGGLLIGLVIAAVVALGNATSSAQLAAQYPSAGGTYLYGREQIGPTAGFLAGWAFVVGKTASCAAMAMVLAAYVAPDGWEKAIGIAAVVAVTTVNCLGVHRTAAVTKVLVVGVLAVLGLVIVAASAARSDGAGPSLALTVDGGVYGVLQSAGLLFFAFAGYARIATLGEEVRDPARVIPRAVVASLTIALLVYAAVAWSVLAVLGPDGLAASAEPLVDAARAGGWDWTGPWVRGAAAAATLGALLALVAGIGRTTLAMARHGDLPSTLAVVHPRFAVPHRAEILVAVVICAVVAVVDLRGAIGFSSFGVLLYYLVANVSAYRQAPDHRRYPRVLQVVGAVGCLVLAATLPWESVLAGVAVLALGLGGRAVVRRQLGT